MGSNSPVAGWTRNATDLNCMKTIERRKMSWLFVDLCGLSGYQSIGRDVGWFATQIGRS